MNKFVYDTMTNKGIWSQKRTLIYASFLFLSFYVTIPMWKSDFEVKEFVVLAIAGVGGFLSYRNQKRNENKTAEDSYTETTETENEINKPPIEQ